MQLRAKLCHDRNEKGVQDMCFHVLLLKKSRRLDFETYNELTFLGIMNQTVQ